MFATCAANPEDRTILDLPAPPADMRLTYGPDALQFGDLRLPKTRDPAPVAIVIHGGFWRAAYDLRHIGHLCAALARAGVATWSLEYRRIGDKGGGWPGTFEDVARGADRLRALAGKYPLDLARVISVGHSAGGHLALWLGAQRKVRLRGVVSLAGVADLRKAWKLRLGNGVVKDLLGGTPDEVPERYRQASPIELLPLGVPQRLVHGAADSIVPFAISRDYQRAAAAAGDDAQLVPLKGTGHFEAIDPRSKAWPVVRQTVLKLLRT
jgi:acetyl esterase/lipase